MRVYTALPVPARRRSGRPLNASSLGRTQSGRLAFHQHARWRASPAAAAHGSRRSSRSSVRRRFQLTRSLVQPASLQTRRVRPNQAMQRTGRVRGFTVLPADPGRRCGRPAADCFFVRPHQPGGWPFALALLVGLQPAAGPRRPRRSSRCGRRRGFQLARSLVQSASPPVRRVRPNQAMQRTGGVRGFTVLPPDPGRRWGRPAADCFFVRPLVKQVLSQSEQSSLAETPEGRFELTLRNLEFHTISQPMPQLRGIGFDGGPCDGKILLAVLKYHAKAMYSIARVHRQGKLSESQIARYATLLAHTQDFEPLSESLGIHLRYLDVPEVAQLRA